MPAVDAYMNQPRKHKRVRMSRKLKPIRAAFRTDQRRAKGEIATLAREGLFIATESLPSAEEAVTIVFQDSSGNKIEVRGTVRWTTEQLPPGKCSKPGFGVQLESPSDAYLAFYEEVLTG